MSIKTINYSNLPSQGLWKLASLSIGALLIVFSLYQAAAFPSFSVGILTLLTAMFVLQLNNRYTWLVFLPVCLVAFDFSTFSGRFIFNELDLIMLMLIGTALITHQFRHKISLTLFSFLPFALITITLVSINFIDLWGAINEPLTQNPYYSTLYSFKVGKGLIYGLVLALLFYNQYKENSTALIKSLIVGGWLGSLIMFIVVLWERHTLVPLFAMQPWWAIASSLLDFTSAYRVTGLFSDMHTGGEAIDGIYLLLVPLNFFGFYWFERNNLRFISLIALFMVCYCIMVGFTRATYFSMAISLFSFAVLFQLLINQDKKASLRNMLIYVTLLASSYMIFANAGYVGVVCFCAIICLGFFGKWLQNQLQLSPNLFILAYSMLCVLISLFAIKTHFDSRWVTHSALNFILLILALIIASSLTYLSVKSQQKLLLSNVILRSSGISIVAIMMAIAFGGTQINSRMETISQDI
ncbi:MAG: hypothetical protein OQK03_03350, partial [Colwellia sp.]|nr:hypothetical protein [Colwellia sp.]